ncbi:MAG: hypothetical protein L0220_13935 [Acidobacteria bacterium]|nr:hypothetical protein [Acidobacteriota bacterium]
MAESSLTFLPFIKRQPALPIVESTPGQLTATLDLKIIDNQGNEHPVGSHSLMLRGPGDILGISPRMFARIEPPPGTHDFEPTYFPYLEFVDPDFPWRYSPEITQASTPRAHPWLSLIILSKEEMDEMQGENIQVISSLADRRQFLSLRGKYLPNLDEAWATAHVHLSGLNQPIETFIENNPSRHCSRLFCFRRLAAETNYSAFLVPNYRAAVNAAFGLGQEDVGKNKAWVEPSAEDLIKLPIYFTWSFFTSESGDFEELARKLTPTAVDPKKIGIRAVDANLVRSSAKVDLKCYFLREGALAAPGYSLNPENKRSLFITTPMLNSLNESLKPPSDEEANIDEDEDPLITIPVYGQYFRKTDEVKPPENTQWSEPSPWIHELNMHFRNRVAAAFGTTVVQKNQDQYMRECWAQVGDIRKANEQRRRIQAGYLTAKTLENKHIKPLSDERFVLFSSPFHAQFAMQDSGETVSVKQALANSGISPGLFSATFRRVAHRQVGIQRVKPTHTIEQVKSGYQLSPLQLKAQPLLTNVPSLFANMMNQIPAADRVKPVSNQPVIPVNPIDTSVNFRARFDIHTVLQDKLNANLVFNDGNTLNIPDNFDPVMAYPKIDEPMYKGVASLSSDYILPGIENLESNGVTLCEENRRFIEAHLVGLNHEMGRELVWRHYPTDQRGTIFSFFWDQVVANNPPPDIKEIHRWQNQLGANKDNVGQSANLVLVIKSDLVRRYPATIVYAMKIPPKGNYWSKSYPNNNPPMTADQMINPIFRAQVGNDILCVGFPFSLQNVQGPARDGEYYFILQENQDLPRFGLDLAGSKRIQESTGCQNQQIDLNDLSWSDVTLDGAGYITEFEQSPLARGDARPTTSATIAYKTYQQPIRVAINASELLAEVDNSAMYQPFTGPMTLERGVKIDRRLK